MSRKFTPNKPVDDTRINEAIRAEKIRLIDANGDMVGVTTVKAGLDLASQRGLDLVEISPNAEPPVCKVLDYGKYKYEQQKKQHEARKKQKVVVVKEVKIRPNIDQHDLEIKLKRLRKFIEAGDKVKFTLMFRGRELGHADIGMKLVNDIKAQLLEEGLVRVDSEPKREGRQAIMMLSPAPTTTTK